MNNSRVSNILIWIAQAILSVMFLMAGIMKSTQPMDQLAAMMPWVNDVPGALVRFIGTMELIGALGLLLPSVLKIKPIVTPYAALGLTVIQVLAAAFHISRVEALIALPINIFLVALAVFVAWGRFKQVPITPKS